MGILRNLVQRAIMISSPNKLQEGLNRLQEEFTKENTVQSKKQLSKGNNSCGRYKGTLGKARKER